MNTVMTHFEHPKLVIGIPVFNEEKFIGETLSSVINQTYKDFTVIISDNASTDNTSTICKEVCLKDHRFHYIQQSSNIGASGNFRYLYENSTSPYFMWLGAHDMIDSSFISTHISALEKDDKCVLSYSLTQWIDENSECLYVTGGSDLDTINGLPIIRYLKSITLLKECTAINQVIRRKALEGLNFDNTNVIAGDLILLSRLIYSGKVNKVDTCFYKRREILSRDSTPMQRITGLLNTKANYQDLIKAYLKDFDSLKGSYLTRKLFRLVVYWFLIDKFIGGNSKLASKIVQLCKSTFKLKNP